MHLHDVMQRQLGVMCKRSVAKIVWSGQGPPQVYLEQYCTTPPSNAAKYYMATSPLFKSSVAPLYFLHSGDSPPDGCTECE